MKETESANVFDGEVWPAFTVRDGLPPSLRWLASPLDRLIGFKRLTRYHAAIRALDNNRHFVDRALEAFKITYEVSESDLRRIPEHGPIVVVANHPFGGVEGILLMSLFFSVRNDALIMGNYLLSRITELKDVIIPVDPFGTRTAAVANTAPLKTSLKHLKNGGMLMVFPGGEVAALRWGGKGIQEAPWSPTIAGLIEHAKCPVLPVFFDGANPLYFQLAGLIHPRLRTLLLPRQMLNKQRATFSIHIGNPIPYRKLAGMERKAMMEYLCKRTLHLRNRRPEHARVLIRLPWPARKAPSADDPVVPAVSGDDLARAVDQLPPESLLVESAGLEARVMRGSDSPCILHEIGRLREITFREVGEGTGEEIDLDDYDQYYFHVFLWNAETRKIVAAYRLGPTDEILSTYGAKGLYTSSLFKFRGHFLDRISPALEMGRSFVCVEYQKNYNSLLMLWKGIGYFIGRHPRYKILFGPVSITDDYRTCSRDLLVAFLKINNFMPDLARKVKPRSPIRTAPLRWIRNRSLGQVAESLDDVEAMIADVETELSGIPILLKQYLKLGGKLLGFNIDPAFNYVLDGLILVDLRETDPKIMQRYMGKENTRKFQQFHNL